MRHNMGSQCCCWHCLACADDFPPIVGPIGHDNCVANLEIQGITFFFFFQLCLYLTVWLAEDCHFTLNSPKRHSWVSHDQNVHIWGVKNAQFWGKNTKSWKKCFVLNAPKVICPMTNNLHFLWAKNPCKKTQTFCFVPNAPKNHLGMSNNQNLHFFVGQKCQKLQKSCKKDH